MLSIKMKLDQSTMFEWQKHTQANSDVPHYTEILEFIDLRARAYETVFYECPKRHLQPVPRKDSAPNRTSYVRTLIQPTCRVVLRNTP